MRLQEHGRPRLLREVEIANEVSEDGRALADVGTRIGTPVCPSAEDRVESYFDLMTVHSTVLPVSTKPLPLQAF